MTKKDMTIYRTDIEKALDEMSANEEGMRFQGLAVVLAKLKWPEFIASERHNDLGLDAYAPASCANDTTEKGLASSITTTIDKIKKDIERFKPHYPNVKVLIFATPHKVTNQQAKSWKETIGKDCGIELQIISREDIITDLISAGLIPRCLQRFRLRNLVLIPRSLLRGNSFELVNYWHADHLYRHTPGAIEAFCLLTMLAFILFHAFIGRNLKPEIRYKYSKINLARIITAELFRGLIDIKTLFPP